MKNVSSTRFDVHGFLFVCAFSSFLRLCDLFSLELVSELAVGAWAFSNTCVRECVFLKLFAIGLLVLPLLRLAFLVPLLAWLFLSVSQGSLQLWPRVTSLLLKLENAIDNAIPQISHPVYGVNSKYTDIVAHYFNMLSEFISELEFAFDVSRLVRARKLRNIGLSMTMVDISERPLLDPHCIVREYEKALFYQKIVILAGVSMIFLCVFSSPIFLVVPAFYYCMLWFEKGPAFFINKTAARSPISPGIYRVEVCYFGIPTSHGIGTCYNNVLHVPYHVCSGSDIVVNGAKYNPYYINVEEDVVTYAGPPQFTLPERHSPIYVNCEAEETRTTYVTNANVSDDETMFAWYSVTQPGESGSPIFIQTDVGLVLVGLAGRYYQSVSGDRIEFAAMSGQSLESASVDNYTRIIRHPGSGKTRKEIPDIVSRFLCTSPGKILVSGVSVLVCLEIYRALKERFVDVGLSVRGQRHLANPRARVQVCAHQTAVALINSGSQNVQGLGHVVIDEAHSDNVGTILLRKMGRHLMEKGVHLTEMSATLDGVIDDGSNYNIDQEQITKAEVSSRIEQCLSDGKRVMVFVPSLNNGYVRELVRRYKIHDPILLSRATFDDASVQLRDETYRLIFSTDISECGVNVPDLDVVIDLSEKFTFVVSGKLITKSIVIPDHASVVQRRGRVGRTKPGLYLFVHGPKEKNYISANELDADILSSGRRWGGFTNNPLGITLTEYQFETWVRSEKPPTWIWFAYDTLGKVRKKPELSTAYRHLTSETPMSPLMSYTGCKDCRDCVGRYVWYDERMHSDLCNAKKDVLEFDRVMVRPPL